MTSTASGNLSPEQIGAYASKAGFSGNDLKIAVAVALAESGGNPRAHNAVPPDDSYGLWQINMLGSMGPERRKRFGITSNDALFDPEVNARAAHTIWQGSGWNAWTTYTRGTYKKYLDTSGFLGDVKKGAEVVTGVDSLTGVSQAIDNVGQNLFKGAASLVAILVVGFLFITGMVILARNTAPVQAVKAYAKKGVKKVGK